MSFRATLSVMLIQGASTTLIVALCSTIAVAAAVSGVYLVGVLATIALRRQLDVQGAYNNSDSATETEPPGVRHT